MCTGSRAPHFRTVLKCGTVLNPESISRGAIRLGILATTSRYQVFENRLLKPSEDASQKSSWNQMPLPIYQDHQTPSAWSTSRKKDFFLFKRNTFVFTWCPYLKLKLSKCLSQLKYNSDTSCRKSEYIYKTKFRYMIESILIIIIIIYHDFLPTPRSGSHVELDKTHTVIKIHPLAHILDA